MSEPAAPRDVVAAESTRLADGAWHRLHPATPLLRGGIAFVAVLGFVIVNLRDVVVETLIGVPYVPGGEDELVGEIIERGLVGIVLAAVLVVLLLCVVGFWISWRMHTFRITDEVVEVRSGILFRTNRKGRLDRIQGINIVRPFFARLFGAARLEVSVAGQDANIQLAYLGGRAADALRREILHLASGTHEAAAAAPDAEGPDSLIERRVAELLAPERDPSLAPPESVVSIPVGRLIGSLVLSSSTAFIVAAIIAAVIGAVVYDRFFILVFLAAPLLGSVGFLITRFTRSLRYSIAGTPDGVRVGFGLLSTTNETLPPGRVHSVEVSQPLLWRPTGWWQVRFNRAGSSSAQGAAGNANTTILPVGSLDDVLTVLGLVLPSLATEEARATITTGLTSTGGDDGYTNSPRRAAALRWFSWRRNGFRVEHEVVLLRRGRLWRSLVVVPTPRIQALGIRQGPVLRRLDLAAVRVHTVSGPIIPRLGAVDRLAAQSFFEGVAALAVSSAERDRSHRWRSDEATA